MDNQTIQMMQTHFDLLSHKLPDEDIEFWFARDLMEPLGYARWENFITAIKIAIESCETTGYRADDQFPDAGKLIGGSGGKGLRSGKRRKECVK